MGMSSGGWATDIVAPLKMLLARSPDYISIMNSSVFQQNQHLTFTYCEF
jgi:hypothetical protein